MKKKISTLCDQVFEYGEKYRTFENWQVAIGTYLSLLVTVAVIFFKLHLPVWVLVYSLYKTVTFILFVVSISFRTKDGSTFDVCTVTSILSDLDAVIIMKAHYLLFKH